MFNYTNTFVINSSVDKKSGMPKWSAQEAQGGKPANFSVKRCGNFTADNVVKIWKNAYSEGTKGSVKLTMRKGNFGVGGSGAGTYQIMLWVMLSGATAPQDSRYANDFVEKGKPYVFSIEVTDSTSTSDMANAFANQINRMSQEYDDYELIATVSGNDITITHGEADMAYYLKFVKAQLMQFDETRQNPARYEYSVVAEGEKTEPVEPFGTYDYMIRTIELPTYANRAWLNPNEELQPIVGGKYNQYTIRMRSEVGVQGMSHIGQIVEAETLHVFYVLDSISSEFESALSKVGTVENGISTFSAGNSVGTFSAGNSALADKENAGTQSSKASSKK